MTIPAEMLPQVADTLAALPALSIEDRASIFTALDLAPGIPTNGTYDPAAPYGIAWDVAKEIVLSAPRATHALTLWEASGFTTVPTRREILAALTRARKLIDA